MAKPLRGHSLVNLLFDRLFVFLLDKCIFMYLFYWSILQPFYTYVGATSRKEAIPRIQILTTIPLKKSKQLMTAKVIFWIHVRVLLVLLCVPYEFYIPRSLFSANNIIGDFLKMDQYCNKLHKRSKDLVLLIGR